MSTYSLADDSTYFECGLKAHVLIEAVVKEWALSIVEADDEPSCEVVEVLSSRSMHDMLDNLRAVPGDRDYHKAGRRLLKILGNEALQADADGHHICQKAMRIAVAAHLGEDVEFAFSCLQDQFNIAELGQYGSVAECMNELRTALARHGHGVHDC